VPDPIPGGSPAQLRSLFGSFVIDPGLILDHVLSAEHIAAVVAQELGKTRDRIFTPLVTLAVFLAQVLGDDQTCLPAVARLLAWRIARGLPGCSPDTGGYCKARQRLPETLLPRLARETADRLQDDAPEGWLFHGRRVTAAREVPARPGWIVDGETPLATFLTEAGFAANDERTRPMRSNHGHVFQTSEEDVRRRALLGFPGARCCRNRSSRGARRSGRPALIGAAPYALSRGILN